MVLLDKNSIAVPQLSGAETKSHIKNIDLLVAVVSARRRLASKCWGMMWVPPLKRWADRNCCVRSGDSTHPRPAAGGAATDP